MASPSGSTDVCQTCGVKGTAHLLISCVQCNDSLVHHYCLNSFKPEDDNINWMCEDCVPKASKVSPSRRSKRITLKKVQAIKARVNWRERLNKNGSVSRRRTAVKGGIMKTALPENVCSAPAEEKRNQCMNDAVKGGILETARPRNVCSAPAEKKRNQLVNDNTFGNQEHQKKRRKLVLEDEDEDIFQEDKGFCSSFSNVSVNTANCCPPLETDNHFISSPQTEEMKKNQVSNQEHRKKRRRFVLDDEADLEEDSAKANTSVSSSSYVSPSMAEDLPPLAPDNKADYLPSLVPVNKADYLPSLAPVNNRYAHPSREHVWRVGFDINQGKNKINVGMLAHFQVNACPQAFEAAKMLPPVLNIEVLPRMEIWPKSFQETPPTDYQIALYFFPDSEREEKRFDSVLEDVIEHDLALKASMDHIELLVFPSLVLPQQHWRFRKKYYFWGVFKPRKCPPKSPETLDATVTKSSGSSGLKDYHAAAASAAAAPAKTGSPCSLTSASSHVSNPPSPSPLVHRSSSSSLPESFSFCSSKDGCRSDRTRPHRVDEVRKNSKVHQEGCKGDDSRAEANCGDSETSETSSDYYVADKIHIHFTAHLGFKDKIVARRRQVSGNNAPKECRNWETSSKSTISSASGSRRRGVF